MTFLVKWQPARKEWDPDLQKPFLVQVLKKAVFSNLLDLEFLFYFKNSLAVMCEIWLKRAGIDPMINAGKNFHALQDEFFKVLAQINRGFELEVNADWKGGVGRLIELWRNIERESEAQWNDYKEERRKGDPASRFELKEEPKQDVADAFWVSMFRKGRKWRKEALGLAEAIDGQQARFFFSPFESDEHKTFTDTKTHVLRNTQEAWVYTTLSSKLGLSPGYDFLGETFAASLKTIKKAQRIIREGNAKLWLIKNFFQINRREWVYLLGTLTGGHVPLERLFGNLITTIILKHDRKSFELKEEDAGELFRIFWIHGLTLPYDQAEHVACFLHQAIVNAKEYKIYADALTVLSALRCAGENGKRHKTFSEAGKVLSALNKEINQIVRHQIYEAEIDLSGLEVPIDTEKKYWLLIAKLELIVALEMEIHKVVEEIFWKVIETFSDLIRAYKIQKKRKLSVEEKEALRKIAQKYYLRPEEKNFLSYAPDRCYVGKELGYFSVRLSREGRTETPGELFFAKKTQKIKKDYLIPPIHIRRELISLCGRYGKIIADITDKKKNKVFPDAKLIWTPAKIQVTDRRYLRKIKPQTLYEIKIKQAFPRKLREKWE